MITISDTASSVTASPAGKPLRLLPEDSAERADFNRFSEEFGGPLLHMAATCNVWARTYPQEGSLAKLFAIMHNELLRADRTFAEQAKRVTEAESDRKFWRDVTEEMGLRLKRAEDLLQSVAAWLVQGGDHGSRCASLRPPLRHRSRPAPCDCGYDAIRNSVAGYYASTPGEAGK